MHWSVVCSCLGLAVRKLDPSPGSRSYNRSTLPSTVRFRGGVTGKLWHAPQNLHQRAFSNQKVTKTAQIRKKKRPQIEMEFKSISPVQKYGIYI